MKILLLGQNHLGKLFLQKIKSDQPETKFFAIPGHSSWGSEVACSNIPLQDFQSILRFIEKNRIDFTISLDSQVGKSGILDYLVRHKKQTFGPHQKLCEWSQNRGTLHKTLMKYGIPIGNGRVFQEKESALSYVESLDSFPLFFKPTSGDPICEVFDQESAQEKIQFLLEQPKAVDVPRKELLIEEFMGGFELSYYAFVDGDSTLPLDLVRIYKTRGGPKSDSWFQIAYNPWKSAPKKLHFMIEKDFLFPLSHLFTAKRMKFRGLLELNLMANPSGVKLINLHLHWNPGIFITLLRKMKGNFLSTFYGTATRKLENSPFPEWNSKKSLTLIVPTSKNFRHIVNPNNLPSSIQMVPFSDDQIAFNVETTNLVDGLSKIQENLPKVGLVLKEEIGKNLEDCLIRES